MASEPAPAPGARRDKPLDALRGLALLVIYTGHVRGNLLALWTPAALGYSDMAELFVWLSGYVSGLALMRRAHRFHVAADPSQSTPPADSTITPHRVAYTIHSRIVFGAALRRSLIRAIQLWAAWAVTALALIALVGLLDNGPLRTMTGPPHAMSQADPATWQNLLQLRLPVGPLNILLMYALFVLALPIAIRLCRADARLLLAASATVYLIAQLLPWQWQLPGERLRSWYFAPLAWQSLFFTAAAFSLDERLRHRFTRSPAAQLAAIATLAGLLVLRSTTPLSSIPGIGKSLLEPLRLLHFFALILIANALLPSTGKSFWNRSLPRVLRLCGRHSLTLFCTGVLAAELATRWLEHVPPTAAAPAIALVNIGGWALLTAIACASEQATRPKRPGPGVPSTGSP